MSAFGMSILATAMPTCGARQMALPAVIDVSATQGVELMTEKAFVAGGKEYEVDCMIFASGFESSSELKRRWGILVIEGRGGLSIYRYWNGEPETLHGTMTRDFPNMYFTGHIQGGLNSSTTEQFNQQVEHASYIIDECLRRDVATAEPSREGQAAYVRHFREIGVDTSSLIREGTSSYYSNEGDAKPEWLLLRGYGHGWNAFMQVLADWRADGSLSGLELE